MFAWGVFADSESDKFEVIPTCSFLDYLLVIEKVQLGADQVIVLPETYKKQQEQLAKILGKLVIPDLSSYCMQFFSMPDLATTTLIEEVQL